MGNNVNVQGKATLQEGLYEPGSFARKGRMGSFDPGQENRGRRFYVNQEVRKKSEEKYPSKIPYQKGGADHRFNNIQLHNFGLFNLYPKQFVNRKQIEKKDKSSINNLLRKIFASKLEKAERDMIHSSSSNDLLYYVNSQNKINELSEVIEEKPKIKAKDIGKLSIESNETNCQSFDSAKNSYENEKQDLNIESKLLGESNNINKLDKSKSAQINNNGLEDNQLENKLIKTHSETVKNNRENSRNKSFISKHNNYFKKDSLEEKDITRIEHGSFKNPNHIKYKNSDYIRCKYYTNLVSNSLWVKQDLHNSISILDWDDTLLCTTFLTPKGVFEENLILNEKQKIQVQSLEELVYALLKRCISDTDTYIVTNASAGWVEYSAARYYPKVAELLKSITIISARELFERENPKNMRRWKIESFKLIVSHYQKAVITNILCIGDSFIEMEAGHIVAGSFEKAYIKSVKFKESPKIEELIKQIKLVNNQYDSIFKSIKSLTVTVEKKPK